MDSGLDCKFDFGTNGLTDLDVVFDSSTDSLSLDECDPEDSILLEFEFGFRLEFVMISSKVECLLIMKVGLTGFLFGLA